MRLITIRIMDGQSHIHIFEEYVEHPVSVFGISVINAPNEAVKDSIIRAIFYTKELLSSTDEDLSLYDINCIVADEIATGKSK